MNIMFFGDPHGDFFDIHGEVAAYLPDAIVLLGDMDLDRPIDEEFDWELSQGIRVLFIPGNHDYDHEHWHDNLLSSQRCENLHGRVIDVEGVRLAGLGGNFQSKIWHPHNVKGEPLYTKRKDFMRTLSPPQRWRKGLPRKTRGAVWREDIEKLSSIGANILVSHEAPSCHRHGFEVIDHLARDLGAKVIVHGHHHISYRDTVDDIDVVGVDKGDHYTFRTDQ